MLIDFREKKREGQRQGERNIGVREKHQCEKETLIACLSNVSTRN